MARFLVTGAAGFIGAQVCAELLRRGETVVGVDNLNDAYDPRLKEWRLARLHAQEGFTFLRLDIADAASVHALAGRGPFEAVLNLAARAGVRASVRAPELYVQANMIGALNMLELCRAQGIPKFVQASTSSLYGAHNPRPFSEQADISRPLSPYAATKGGAEMLCHSFHALHGLDVSILRYFTVYGPAGRPEMSIFRFVQWVEEGRPIVLYGDGTQERDFTYIDDIVRGTLAALTPLGFEVINLGSDRPIAMSELIRMLERLAGKPAVIDRRPEAPGDVRATWADIAKAGRLLGWEPRVGLEDGLRACLEWYRAEREWARSIATSD